MKAIITRKVGMSSIINDDGVLTPITVLHAETNTITAIKNEETHGYSAVQLGMGTKKLGKAQAGQYKESKVHPAIVREFRGFSSGDEVKVGEQVNVDSFDIGDHVSVTGTSKGKGWAGTIKRHNFHRGRKTHGGRSYRRVGSIGSMYPQHILKGKKMAGQMGHEQVTTKGLMVAFIDTENRLIGVKGSVPGPRKSVVLIKGEQ